MRRIDLWLCKKKKRQVCVRALLLCYCEQAVFVLQFVLRTKILKF